jgi:hypothetical protein
MRMTAHIGTKHVSGAGSDVGMSRKWITFTDLVYDPAIGIIGSLSG